MASRLTKSIVGVFAVLAVALALVFFLLNRQSRYYRDEFSKVELGMSKSELTSSVGSPILIDTIYTGYEVWIYDVPSIFAERPRCYFKVGDSTLSRFVWEPVDISLPADTASLEEKPRGHDTKRLADSIFNANLSRLRAISERSEAEGSDVTLLNTNDTLHSGVNFIEKVTGIVSAREGNYLGWVYTTPGAFAKDLEKWEEWYARNKGQLIWDSVTQSIVLTP